MVQFQSSGLGSGFEKSEDSAVRTRGVYSPPSVDRIWLWVNHNKIPIYPIFYVLKGDYTP